MTWTKTFEPEQPMMTWAEVQVATGLPKHTIKGLIAAGTFPAPYKPNQRVTRWSRSVIADWLAKRGTSAAVA